MGFTVGVISRCVFLSMAALLILFFYFRTLARLAPRARRGGYCGLRRLCRSRPLAGEGGRAYSPGGQARPVFNPAHEAKRAGTILERVTGPGVLPGRSRFYSNLSCFGGGVFCFVDWLVCVPSTGGGGNMYMLFPRCGFVVMT